MSRPTQHIRASPRVTKPTLCFQDTWMFPNILLFYPEAARAILEYRIRTLDGAMHNAQELGYKVGAQHGLLRELAENALARGPAPAEVVLCLGRWPCSASHWVFSSGRALSSHGRAQLQAVRSARRRSMELRKFTSLGTSCWPLSSTTTSHR